MKRRSSNERFDKCSECQTRSWSRMEKEKAYKDKVAKAQDVILRKLKSERALHLIENIHLFENKHLHSRNEETNRYYVMSKNDYNNFHSKNDSYKSKNLIQENEHQLIKEEIERVLSEQVSRDFETLWWVADGQVLGSKIKEEEEKKADEIAALRNFENYMVEEVKRRAEINAPKYCKKCNSASIIKVSRKKSMFLPLRSAYFKCGFCGSRQ